MNCRVARFHNIFRPEDLDSSWRKAAAICRKVASALDQGTIEIWVTAYRLDLSSTSMSVLREPFASCVRPLPACQHRSEEMVTINRSGGNGDWCLRKAHICHQRSWSSRCPRPPFR